MGLYSPTFAWRLQILKIHTMISLNANEFGFSVAHKNLVCAKIFGTTAIDKINKYYVM